MSGIYIPNLEMPKDGHFLQILIAENGDMSYEYVSYNSPHMGFTLHKSKAIEVPIHGDLIDRQKLLEHRFEVYDSNEEVCEDYIETCHVLEAPAIIEAST